MARILYDDAAATAFAATRDIPRDGLTRWRAAIIRHLRPQAGALTLDRRAHTPLQLISDADYAAGLRRLRAAAAAADGPVIDVLDLLVLR